MAPMLEITDKNYKSESSDDKFIYVPSTGLYVAKERSLHKKNWGEAHEGLRRQRDRMLTFPEFVELLKHVKKANPMVYKDITQVRVPLRSEWIDAYFEQREDGMYILTEDRTKAEKLDEDTLMEERSPGISLDSWLENPTSQGLPRKDVKRGELSYYVPENGRVGMFVALSLRASLICTRDPSTRYYFQGVRAVRKDSD